MDEQTLYSYHTKLPTTNPDVLALLGWSIREGFWLKKESLRFTCRNIDIYSCLWNNSRIEWQFPRQLTSEEQIELIARWEKPEIREVDIRLAEAIIATTRLIRDLHNERVEADHGLQTQVTEVVNTAAAISQRVDALVVELDKLKRRKEKAA